MAPEQKVKESFRINGKTVADWAAEHGFNANLVYSILDGERKCYGGQSYQIAVLLGLKQAKTTEAEDNKKTGYIRE